MRSKAIAIDKEDVGSDGELQPVRLGKHGTFADVYAAVYCNDTPVAVKMLRCPISALAP